MPGKIYENVQLIVPERVKLLGIFCQTGANVKVQAFQCLRVVIVLQVLGAKPLLEGKVSEQLDVRLCNFPPALLFLHHLFQTTQYAQTQFLQCLYIWMTHEQHIKILHHTLANKSACRSMGLNTH